MDINKSHFTALLWAIQEVVFLDEFALEDLAGVLELDMEEVMEIFNEAAEIFHNEGINE